MCGQLGVRTFTVRHWAEFLWGLEIRFKTLDSCFGRLVHQREPIPVSSGAFFPVIRLVIASFVCSSTSTVRYEAALAFAV